jgi:hypothetical protein
VTWACFIAAMPGYANNVKTNWRPTRWRKVLNHPSSGSAAER